MELRGLWLLVLGLVLLSGSEGSPALKELPSITWDTLPSSDSQSAGSSVYGGDSDTAESVGPVGVITGLTALNRFRNYMLRSEEPVRQESGIRYYWNSIPMRLARNVGSEFMSMAKTFANTFNEQLQNQYNSMSQQLETKYIPEAANYLGIWTNPAQESTQWMEGV